MYAGDFVGPCPPGTTPGKTECEAVSSFEATKMYNDLINGLNIILGVITVIVSPAIMFAGWLMSPDWTSGDLFGLRTPMYALWVTVSNIVYFIYAILLILIALGTMFGQDKFSYKVMLPKLALGMLMVPFTWVFVQWTISIASFVTASVITIPAETMSSNNQVKWDFWTTPSIPNTIVISETSGTAKPIKVDCKLTQLLCTTPEQFLTKSAGMYGYMLVYAYSIFKFQDVKNLPTTTDILKQWVSIVHQGIIAAIMFLVFGLLTMALVAMLLIRAIKLWVYAIFSPLFTFRYVAGSNLMGWDEDTFTIKEFIGLAFVPAIVWLTLSFGLIMINAVSTGSPTTGNTGNACNEDKIKTEPWCTLATIMGNPNNTITRWIDSIKDPTSPTTINMVTFGGIKMRFEGKAGTAQDESKSANSTTGVLDAAWGIFGTLIIDIIALVFIWMAFMAAKNVSKAVKMAVQPFEDMWNKIGGIAKSIPKYAPIPGLGMSANSLSKVPDKIQAGIETRSNEKAADSALGKLVGLEGRLSKQYTSLKQAEGKDKLTQLELNALQQDVRTIVGTKGTISSEAQEAINRFAKIVEKSSDNEVLKNNIKDAKGLMDGSQLSEKGSHLILGNLNDRTHIRNMETVKKLTIADSNYSWSVGWTDGKTTSIVSATVKITEDGINKITVLNEPIQFKLKTNWDIDGVIIWIDKLKDKKAGMKKSEFITLLRTNGNLTVDTAQAFAEAADKVPGFFEK